MVMVYATKADLADYIGVEETNLPVDAERLLERASELMDAAALGRIDPNNAEHIEVVKKATCAQVEFWVQAGEQQDVAGPIEGYRIGGVQIQYGSGESRVGPTVLAPRAKRYLFMSGLLYRGVSMK